MSSTACLGMLLGNSCSNTSQSMLNILCGVCISGGSLPVSLRSSACMPANVCSTSTLVFLRLYLPVLGAEEASARLGAFRPCAGTDTLGRCAVTAARTSIEADGARDGDGAGADGAGAGADGAGSSHEARCKAVPGCGACCAGPAGAASGATASGTAPGAAAPG